MAHSGNHNSTFYIFTLTILQSTFSFPHLLLRSILPKYLENWNKFITFAA